MALPGDRLYLNHILQAIDRIDSYLDGVDENAFFENSEKQDAGQSPRGDMDLVDEYRARLREVLTRVIAETGVQRDEVTLPLRLLVDGTVRTLHAWAEDFSLVPHSCGSQAPTPAMRKVRGILPYAALSLLLSCSPSEPDLVWTLPDLSGTWTMHGTADPTVPIDGRYQFGPIIFTLSEDESARHAEKRVFRGSRPASEMICVGLTEEEIARSGLENSRRAFPAEPMAFEVRVAPVYRGRGVGLFFNVDDGLFDTLLLSPEDITTTTQTTLNGFLRFPNFIGGSWTAARSASAGSPPAG